VAIARGTPQQPLTEPEDLFEAKIVDATPKARELGVRVGMTGREAVETLLAASPKNRRARPLRHFSQGNHARSRPLFCSRGVTSTVTLTRPFIWYLDGFELV